MKKKIGIGLLIVLLGIQFIRIDKSTPELKEGNDIISIEKPNEEIQAILKTSCYDCHSYESKYPWYSNIAPISWFLGHHIDEGREHLNFSEWGSYDAEKREHKLEECAEEVEEHEMPLMSYTWMHSEASLSEEQIELLAKWFESI